MPQQQSQFHSKMPDRQSSSTNLRPPSDGTDSTNYTSKQYMSRQNSETAGNLNAGALKESKISSNVMKLGMQQMKK